MDNKDWHSVRKYFVYDSGRSLGDTETFFFRYLGPHAHNSSEQEENFYVIIEKNEITFKQETLTYKNGDKNELISTSLKNLLVIPKNTEHHTFLEIETQLIRLKKNDENLTKPSRKGTNFSFENFLHHFIEDLYVHRYFRDCGNVQGVKSALEHIPLVQGIIFKFLFDYYYQECKVISKNDWRISYKREAFEDAYLNYSRFLANQHNEKLFIEGGWFVRKADNKKNNLDDELLRVEQSYLEIEDKLETSEFLFTQPVNLKQILRRYGIYDILRLGMPAWMHRAFPVLLLLLVSFILLDVLFFNLKESKWNEWVVNALIATSVLFVGYTAVTAILLGKKFRLNSIPGIFLPRLGIAIVSGWLVFFTAEELLKIDVDIEGWRLMLVAVAIFIVTVFFMIFEINNYAPAMTTFRVVKRSLIVTGLAFLISYTFGFWVMSHVNEKFMSIDNFMVNESEFKRAFDEWESKSERKIEELHKSNDNLKGHLTILNGLKDSSIQAINECFSGYIYKIDNSEMKLSQLLNSVREVRDLDSSLKVSIDSFNEVIGIHERLYIAKYANKLTEQCCDFGYFELTLDSTSQKINSIQINYDMNLVDKISRKFDSIGSSNEYFMKYLGSTPEAQINKKKVYSKTYTLSEKHNYHHTTFPNMLLLRALLAMFIGIFLQLIIQSNTITEPI